MLPTEVEDVLNIPLPLSPRENILIWPFTKNGCTTMKSVYHRLRERGQMEDGKSSLGRALWSTIWRAKARPKFKAFMWKLGSNTILVRSNLERIGLPTSTLCPTCDEVETQEHLMFGCGWMHTIWQGALG